MIGTCSTAEKEALARGAGCDEVIRYDDGDFVAVARAGRRGAASTWSTTRSARTRSTAASQCLRPRGLLVLFGQSSGPVPPFDLQRLNAGGSLFVTRPSLAHYMATRAELEERSAAVLGAVAKRELDVRIGGRFPLERAADAHRALEGRGTTGKLLLVP